MSSSSSTPLNLRGEGDHPEIGIRVDNKGIAYDAKTGKSLSRSEVDARVASFQTANPGTDVYGLEKKRGGVAGFYDKNKKIITPIAEIGAGLLGGPLGGALYGALAGGLTHGLDRPGKSGISLDAGQALRGGVEGGLLGYGANQVAGAIGEKGVGGALKAGVTKLGSVAKKAGSTLLGGGGAGDLLGLGLGAIPVLDGLNRQKQQEKTANTQVNNASAGNAAMAELAKALIARGSAPAAAPDLSGILRGAGPSAPPPDLSGILRGSGPVAPPDVSGLIDTRNPYARPRPLIAPPLADPTTGSAGTPPGASVAGIQSGWNGDAATFGGVKPGRGTQLGASVTATPGATYDPATFGGLKQPPTLLGASVAATPGETWDPSVGLGGLKPGRTLLGTQLSGSVAATPGETWNPAIGIGGAKRPVTPPGASVAGVQPTPTGGASSGIVGGAMPAGQTMASLLEMARQNAPKPPPGGASSVMGALPPGATIGAFGPPPGITLESILAGIKSPVQPPAAPAPQSGMMGGLPAGTSIAGFKPEGAAIKSWGTEPGGAMSGTLGRLPTPPAASVAATPINSPYSTGGAKPWTVADAKLSGAVPGAFPTSVPNFDPKTRTEIKSWDTEAPQKKRPKPLVIQELQF